MTVIVITWLLPLGQDDSGRMDNGLLFHMTQSTNRSTTRSHCTKQTNQ